MADDKSLPEGSLSEGSLLDASLFRYTADLMCELDGSGRLLRVNAAQQSFFGPDLATTGTEFGSLFDPAHEAEIARALDRVRHERRTAQFDARVQPPTTGSDSQAETEAASAWTSWQLTRLSNGTVMAVGRDITDHGETKLALEAKRAFLKSVIEAEPECVKLISATGTLLQMNRAGLQMIGAPSPDAALGRCIYELVAPQDRERYIQFNQRVCAGQGGELSFEVIAFDGTRRAMETTAVPLASERGSGEMLHLAITRDVTQRHALENQLRQSQRMEAVGQLAGGIAHDFNNLLTAIIGPAELALLSVAADSAIAEDLRQIKAAGERAARLTQQLLAFARRQVVRLTELSLGELVLGMDEMLQRVLGEAYRLELVVDPLAPWVRADRGQMEQVVLNLVVNARDATAEGGSIRIHVEPRRVTAADGAQLGCEPGDYTALSVTDYGAGIPEATKPHVFEPFFTTKPLGSGTGLGLATCYGITTQLGGFLGVESTEGEGATFTVLLPAFASPHSATPAADPPRRGQSESVLVVEDEAAVRQTVSRLLRSLGYTVHEAVDGEDALRKVAAMDRLDLLLTDMTMPGIDGHSLAKLVVASRPDVPVLYMTGYLTRPTEALEGAPARSILQKPFDCHDLAEAVARALDGDAAGAHAPQGPQDGKARDASAGS